MKALILLSLLFCSISCEDLNICSLPPKRRPIQCYIGQVLDEDIPELKELLEKYRDGDDDEFKDYLGDMLDKKSYKEGKTRFITVVSTRCLPKVMYFEGYPRILPITLRNLPFYCYENNVLRRNRNELKKAYDTLVPKKFEEFNIILVKLEAAKLVYFGIKKPFK